MAKRKKLTQAERRKHGLPEFLSLSSQKLHKDAWYYEDHGGIDIHVWTRADRALSKGEAHHVRVKIPWRKLQASMRRKQLELGKRRAVGKGEKHGG